MTVLNYFLFHVRKRVKIQNNPFSRMTEILWHTIWQKKIKFLVVYRPWYMYFVQGETAHWTRICIDQSSRDWIAIGISDWYFTFKTNIWGDICVIIKHSPVKMLETLLKFDFTIKKKDFFKKRQIMLWCLCNLT